MFNSSKHTKQCMRGVIHKGFCRGWGFSPRAHPELLLTPVHALCRCKWTQSLPLCAPAAAAAIPHLHGRMSDDICCPPWVLMSLHSVRGLGDEQIPAQKALVMLVLLPWVMSHSPDPGKFCHLGEVDGFGGSTAVTTAWGPFIADQNKETKALKMAPSS